MDIIKQDSYVKKHTQSTIRTAIVKEKEIKQEPIQKIQTRQKQEYRKDKTKTPTTAKQHKRETTADFVDNRIGYPYTSARGTQWNATTATK